MSERPDLPAWRVNNWYLFGAMVVLNLSLVWLVKEQVLRPEFIKHFWQEQVEISRLEDQVDLLRSWFNLNYFFVPLGLVIKFCFVSFVLQFPLLVLVEDIAYKIILRVVMMAYLAIIAGSVMQYALLWSTPVDTIEMESLGRMPLSLAGLAAAGYPDLSSPAKMVFNRFNLFELLWCAIIYFKLRGQVSMKHGDLFILVAGVWIFLLILQWLSAEVLILLSV
jgi:hypothetical protein